MRRREFLSLLIKASAAASLSGCSSLAGPRPEDLYRVPAFGSARLLHITDTHAQLMPVYFREPHLNLGIGPAEGKLPHRVGRNLLSVGLRADVHEEFAKPESEWSLLPYGTIQYFLVPNGLVVHQLDHIETWIVEPLSVNRTRTITSVYAPKPPETEKAHNYFVKNLDLLLQVTGTEDFTLMQQIQESLDAGALPELVYGAIEPPLIHFHEQVNRAIAG